MSASALTARVISNMEEESSLDGGGGGGGGDKDSKETTPNDVLDDDMVLLEKPDMTSQQEEVDAQLRAMAVSTTTRPGVGGGADTAPSSTGTRSAGESIDGRDVSTAPRSRPR